MVNKNNESGFCFCGKALFLTYKSWLDEKQIEKVLEKWKDYKYDAVHEESDKKHPYKHTHILLWFCKKIQTTKVRSFDCGDIHPHIKFVVGRNHWKNLVPYIRKQNEPFIVKLSGNEYLYLGSIRELIQEKKRWRDVVNDDNLVEHIRDRMNWAKEVFQCKPRKKFFRHKKLRPWQEEVKKLLYAQEDREVLWLCCENGKSGKTQLGKNLMDDGGFYTRGGNWNNIAYRYAEESVVIYDLTRTQEEFIPYKQIETFKDGIIESGKYMSTIKAPEEGYCKIIIMANYYPDVSKLTMDRWRILTIENGKINCETKIVPEVLSIIDRTSKVGEDEMEQIEVKRHSLTRIGAPASCFTSPELKSLHFGGNKLPLNRWKKPPPRPR